MRNILAKIEIAARLDQGDKMIRCGGICDDVFDKRNGVETTTTSFYRLVINRPIALELRGARQIDFGKLILFIGSIGIVRIATMNKNPRHYKTIDSSI